MKLVPEQPSDPAFKTYILDYPSELHLTHKVRFEVFVDEQGYTAESELDEKDEGSDHIVLYHRDELIGTVRYYPPLDKLGRLAVIKSARGLGAARILCLALEAHVRSRTGNGAKRNEGKKEVLLVANSQEPVQGMYAKIGYTREGDVFQEDGTPHVRMVKTIQLDP